MERLYNGCDGGLQAQPISKMEDQSLAVVIYLLCCVFRSEFWWSVEEHIKQGYAQDLRLQAVGLGGEADPAEQLAPVSGWKEYDQVDIMYVLLWYWLFLFIYFLWKKKYFSPNLRCQVPPS